MTHLENQDFKELISSAITTMHDIVDAIEDVSMEIYKLRMDLKEKGMDHDLPFS